MSKTATSVPEAKLPTWLRGHGDARVVSRNNTRGSGRTWHLEFKDGYSYDTAYEAGGSNGFRQSEIIASFK